MRMKRRRVTMKRKLKRKRSNSRNYKKRNYWGSRRRRSESRKILRRLWRYKSRFWIWTGSRRYTKIAILSRFKALICKGCLNWFHWRTRTRQTWSCLLTGRSTSFQRSLSSWELLISLGRWSITLSSWDITWELETTLKLLKRLWLCVNRDYQVVALFLRITTIGL
jgi:hypothetical protein